MFGVSGSTVSQYRHQDYSRCPVRGSEAWQAQTFSCVLQHPKHSSEVLVSAQSHQPDVTDVCEHGVDKVLSPLVEDLKVKDHDLGLQMTKGIIQAKVVVESFVGTICYYIILVASVEHFLKEGCAVSAWPFR